MRTNRPRPAFPPPDIYFCPLVGCIKTILLDRQFNPFFFRLPICWYYTPSLSQFAILFNCKFESIFLRIVSIRARVYVRVCAERSVQKHRYTLLPGVLLFFLSRKKGLRFLTCLRPSWYLSCKLLPVSFVISVPFFLPRSRRWLWLSIVDFRRRNVQPLLFFHFCHFQYANTNVFSRIFAFNANWLVVTYKYIR